MKEILIFILIVLNVATVYGQTPKNTRDTISINTTTKVEVFTQETDYFTEKGGDFLNIIKINPLVILSGDIPFYYERKLTTRVMTWFLKVFSI